MYMGVSVRQKSGRWFIFIRHNGERAAKQYKNEAEATAVAAAVRTKITLGEFDLAALKDSRRKEEEKIAALTLREFYEKTVLPLWEGSLSRATYLSYEGSFRVHILDELGHLPVTGIPRDKIKSFLGKLRKKSIATPKKKESDADSTVKPAEVKPEEPRRLLSKETIRNVVAALRSALSEAVESNLIPANPAVRLGKFYKEVRDFHEEIDPFTAEEVSLLLQTTREHYGFENYVMLLTLFHCGLRAGEAAGLYWSDLDARNKTLLVRRQFTRGERGKTKTRKKRAVDVSTVLLAELQTLRKQRQAEYLERGKNEIPDSIFLGPGQIIWDDGKPVGRTEGRPLDMNNWRNRVYWKTCDKAGIRRRRLHDTRHTFASLLLGNGESLKYVSAQLGHASIRMTADVYGHLEVGANRAAMDRLPTLNTESKSASATA
jgi:integrase